MFEYHLAIRQYHTHIAMLTRVALTIYGWVVLPHPLHSTLQISICLRTTNDLSRNEFHTENVVANYIMYVTYLRLCRINFALSVLKRNQVQG